MIASDSPGRVVVETVCGGEVDELADGVSGKADVREVDGVGAGIGAGGIEGAPVAVAIMVASTLVVVGAPIIEGRAEENAFEPAVSWDVAIGTTIRESCEGLMAWGTLAQIEKMLLSTWPAAAQYELSQMRAASPRVNPEVVLVVHRVLISVALVRG
jgi:hypothetical protein